MLKDKTVVITGGAKGIGKAIAIKFAKLGANIAISFMKSTTPDETVAEVEAEGVKCIAIKNNVTDFKDVKRFLDEVKEKFGSIDVLVNNAGITKDGLLFRMSEEDFDKVIEINLKGAFNTIRHVSNIMLKQKSGCIINMASVVGVMGNIGQANYAASKAGLIGLTKTTARELASRGITCNAIAPGFIDTDMTRVLSDTIKNQMIEAIPLKHFGTVDDVAEVAVFLAMNKYITGQVINVDGGMVMH